MVNHPNRSKRRYLLRVELANGLNPIEWETTHPGTARKWFDKAVDTKAPIDGGAGRVTKVQLFRDGGLVKEAWTPAGEMRVR